MALFVLGKRVVKELGLIEMLLEFRCSQSLLDTYLLCVISGIEGSLKISITRINHDILFITTFTIVRGGYGTVDAVSIRPVIDRTLGDTVAVRTIAMIVHHRADGTIDWQLFIFDYYGVP